MRLPKRWAVFLTAGALLVFASSAMAAFPNFSDCPTSNPSITACVDIQSVSGSLEIKGFTVPLGDSLEIRGGLIPAGAAGGPPRFVPPAGADGFFAKPVRIPGGILGIEFPIPGNAVLGTAQLAGPSSSIVLEIVFPVTTLSVPVKVRLDNPILGSNCFIGTNSNPARINLTTGTTSPPPPNRPISGALGELVFEAGGISILGSRNVDNAFAVPGASGCGLFGIIDPIVNLKLRLPSAAGNNTMIVTNNVALKPIRLAEE